MVCDEPKNPWEEKYAEEHERIRVRRRVAFGFEQEGFPAEPAKPQEPIRDLFGLALSGGGIRSALFNEGFLQALSHRGLLRWVDYLCTVSGGGYIGGHLIASGLLKQEAIAKAVPAEDQDQASVPERSFHDDEHCYAMGKNPKSGKLEAKRLDGAGNYLANRIEFVASYAASQALTIAIYLGGIGILATVIALLWRSLDQSTYRRAVGLLGFDWGGELFEAFMPFLSLFLIWLASAILRAVVLSFIKLFDPTSRNVWLPWLDGRWQTFNKRLLYFGVVGSVVIGLAVFLGNGWTRVRADGDVQLNHFAMWFVLAALVSQIAVFMGRHRLFRSEKSETPHWQQMLQQVVAYACIGLAVFALVHWMSREDISHYTAHRDPHLVRGDVSSWRDLSVVGEQFGLTRAAQEVLKTMEDSERAEIKYRGSNASGWNAHQRLRPSLLAIPSTGNPPSPLEKPEVRPRKQPTELSAIWVRFPKLMYITTVEMTTGLAGAFRRESDNWGANVVDFSYPPGLQIPLAAVNREWQEKDRFLERFNRLLQERGTSLHLLHQALVAGMEPEDDANPSATTAKVDNGLEQLWVERRDEFTDWLDEHAAEHDDWGDARKDECLRDAEWVLAVSSDDDERLAKSRSPLAGKHRFDPAIDLYKTDEQKRLVRFNLSLLELMHPRMLHDRAIAVTPVVVHHDQRQRVRWLLFWGFLFAVGYIGTWNLNHQIPLYRYYRRMLGEKFLKGWVSPAHGQLAAERVSFAEAPLASCEATSVGLPYPLILGALLRSDIKSDGNVKPSPFLFTPKYVGITDPAEAFAVDTASFKLPFHSNPIALVDAVTISGSAVAPLMTQNKALRILLDFFNVRLGQWVRKPDGVGSPPRGLDRLGFLGYFTMLREMFRKNSQWRYGFVADGGFVDYLGVHELLKRRCRLIIATDAGSNLGNSRLQTLARLLESAQVELGVKFIDLDHEAPIDFGRLLRNDDRIVPQPFLCMRIRYPDLLDAKADSQEIPNYFIYVQMAITQRDPLEVRQIRDRFPNFPDEPTQNQFYTDEQVSAYRQLGYHIGNRVCAELERWKPQEIRAAVAYRAIQDAKKQTKQASYFGEAVPNAHLDVPTEFMAGQDQPLWKTIERRLLASFRMACYEEISYRKDDIFSEAIWDRREWCFPGVEDGAIRLVKFIQAAIENAKDLTLAESLRVTRDACNVWIRTFEENADVRGAYRRAALIDLDSAIVTMLLEKAFAGLRLYDQLTSQMFPGGGAAIPSTTKASLPMQLDFRERVLMTAHLCVLAVACQQLHRGTPHAIFQIGGRDKLIDLMISIVSGDRSKGELAPWPEWLQEASPEIVEMRRCVFIGAQMETVVSFGYLLAMHVIGTMQPRGKKVPLAQRRREMLRMIRCDKVEELPAVFIDMLTDAKLD